MPIVTIRGQAGSGAPEIGKLVAEKLNIDYVDREIIAEVAERVKWSQQGIEKKETPPGTLGGRIVEALSHTYPEVGYAGAYIPTWEIPLDDISYRTGLEYAIKHLASSGSIVIRGRGSQFILKDYPESVHVLAIAPEDVRIRRFMVGQKLVESEVRKEIDRSDKSHREFIKRYFKADLEDPMNYDIVINTALLAFNDVADIIIQTVEAKERAVKTLL